MVTISVKWPFFYSIRWKLFLVYLLISLVPLLFFFNTIMISIEDYFQEDREKKLLNTANIIVGSIVQQKVFESLADETQRAVLNLDITNKSQAYGCRILLFDSKFVVVSDSNHMYMDKTLLVSEVITAFEKKNAFTIHKEEKTVYAAASVKNERDETVGVVLLVASIEDIVTSVSDIESKLVMYTLITILIMGILVFVVSQLLIDPVRTILFGVQKMSEGRFNERIKISGRDEYSKLAGSINDMAEKLEKVDKSREVFVSNVSHELKTPLSSMKVLSESILLQGTVPEDTYREFLDDIHNEVDRMTQIVNDLLELVKLDQNELTMHFTLIDLNQMLEEIIKRLMPLAEQKKIKLVYEKARDVFVDADDMKLSLAISNLVDNAIKYTPTNGSVKVTIDADHQNAFITVQDTGIGIREEDQGKIYDRFYRVDKTRDRETGGTGLGLSITHAAVLLHHGSIRLTSKEREGSVFIMRVPIHYSSEA